MNLQKAIEILNIELGAWPHKGTDDWYDAIKLGVEAMKAVLKMRHYPFPDEILLLPGETKD